MTNNAPASLALCAQRLAHYRSGGLAAGNLGEGRWALPGGGLDFGEPPDGGAIREVAEETGLLARIDGEPQIFSDTGTWRLAVGDVPYHHVRFVYPMTITGGEERLEVGGSTDAFGWHGPDELAELRRTDHLGDLVVRLLDADGEK